MRDDPTPDVFKQVLPQNQIGKQYTLELFPPLMENLVDISEARITERMVAMDLIQHPLLPLWPSPAIAVVEAVVDPFVEPTSVPEDYLLEGRIRS